MKLSSWNSFSNWWWLSSSRQPPRVIGAYGSLISIINVIGVHVRIYRSEMIAMKTNEKKKRREIHRSKKESLPRTICIAIGNAYSNVCKYRLLILHACVCMMHVFVLAAQISTNMQTLDHKKNHETIEIPRHWSTFTKTTSHYVLNNVRSMNKIAQCTHSFSFLLLSSWNHRFMAQFSLVLFTLSSCLYTNKLEKCFYETRWFLLN